MDPNNHADITFAFVSCHTRTLVQAEDLIVVSPPSNGDIRKTRLNRSYTSLENNYTEWILITTRSNDKYTAPRLENNIEQLCNLTSK